MRSFRTAAAPVLANLSSPLDEACLFECVVYFKERERERERRRDLWFDSEEKQEDKRTNERERKKSSKKIFLFRQNFPLFYHAFLLKYRTLTLIHLPLS